jgi:serine/threonine protein kinase
MDKLDKYTVRGRAENVPDIVIDGKRLSCIGHGNMGAVFVDDKKKYIYKVARLVRDEFNSEVEFAQDNDKRSHLLRLIDAEVLNTTKEGINFTMPEPRDIQWWPEKQQQKWRKRMSNKSIGVLKYPFLHGLSLRDMWRKQSQRSMVVPMLHVLTAIQKMHQRGYVHRDIHSGNIVVEDGKAILIDYGRVFKFDNDDRCTVMDLMSLLQTFHPILDVMSLDVNFEWAPYNEFINKITELPSLTPYTKLPSYKRATPHYKKALLTQYAWVVDPQQAAKFAWVDVGLKKHGLDPSKYIVFNGDLSVPDYLWMLDHWDDPDALKRRLVQLKKQL